MFCYYVSMFSVRTTDKSESLVTIVAIAEPFVAVPQIIEIFKNKDAKSVSLITWFFYTITTMIWLIYGISIKSKPLIITSILALIIDVILIISVLIFK
jgi:MtN3 and saliva related transmembrane protein